MKVARSKHAIALAAGLLSTSLLVPGIASAETPSNEWQFRTSVYGFFPEVGGSVRFPSGSSEIDVNADDLIEKTDFAKMGSFEAQKGRWGVFADMVYMDLGDSVYGTRSLGAGRMPLPSGVTADASLDIEALAFTVAANYRVRSSSTSVVDVFAGARLLDAKGELDWTFSADPIGPIRKGTSEAQRDSWDGIVGVKGRSYFGERKQWFVPYYLDAGTGGADFTWQAVAGLGYAAGWGDVFVTWRHLDYDFGPDRVIEDLQFDGPAIGVAFNW